MIRYIDASIKFGFLIGLILIFIRARGKGYTAKIRYYIWLPIVICLILPMTISLPNKSSTKDFGVYTLHIELDKSMNMVYEESDIRVNEENSIYNSQPLKESVSKLSLGEWIYCVWLTIAIGIAIYNLIRFIIMQRNIDRWSCKDNTLSIRAERLIQKICNEQNTSQRVDIRISEYIESPMVIGVVSPKVYLPTRKYTDKELDMILRHELIHVRRKDNLYKLLVLIARTIHWFNPLVYIMKNSIDRYCEISCDEYVLSQGMCDRESYGKLLLSEAMYINKYSIGHCLNGGKQEMKRRLSEIVNRGDKKRGKIIGVMCISMILMVSSILVISGETKEVKVKEASLENVEKAPKRDIKFDVNFDKLTVAFQYSSYNAEKQMSETLFSDPVMMSSEGAVSWVKDILKDDMFKTITKEAYDELKNKKTMTYKISFIQDDVITGEVRFHDLDTMVYVYDGETSLSKLSDEEVSKKIMDMITFFKPVHFD